MKIKQHIEYLNKYMYVELIRNLFIEQWFNGHSKKSTSAHPKIDQNRHPKSGTSHPIINFTNKELSIVQKLLIIVLGDKVVDLHMYVGIISPTDISPLYEPALIRNNRIQPVDSVCIACSCRNITVFGSCWVFDERIFLQFFYIMHSMSGLGKYSISYTLQVYILKTHAQIGQINWVLSFDLTSFVSLLYPPIIVIIWHHNWTINIIYRIWPCRCPFIKKSPLAWTAPDLRRLRPLRLPQLCAIRHFCVDGGAV